MLTPSLNQIKKFSYTDILGWSVSRYDKFSNCKRAYYYDYYAKHDREFSRDKIDLLKKMTSVPLEIGNIFHDTVKVLLERLLVSEKPIDNARFLDFVRKTTTQYCAGKKFTEVYYGEMKDIDTGLMYDIVKLVAKNFLESPRYEWIIKEALTNKSGWVIEPPGFGETRIGELKAYCKVDFLFPVNGEYYILDWKTGKADERKHKKQLVGYATWAVYHLETTPNLVHPIIVYLKPAFSEMKVEVGQGDIEEFAKTVRRETEELHSFCRDVGLNIPKAKEEFKQTQKLTYCKICNYRELCGM